MSLLLFIFWSKYKNLILSQFYKWNHFCYLKLIQLIWKLNWIPIFFIKRFMVSDFFFFISLLQNENALLFSSFALSTLLENISKRMMKTAIFCNLLLSRYFLQLVLVLRLCLEGKGNIGYIKRIYIYLHSSLKKNFTLAGRKVVIFLQFLRVKCFYLCTVFVCLYKSVALSEWIFFFNMSRYKIID